MNPHAKSMVIRDLGKKQWKRMLIRYGEKMNPTQIVYNIQ
jgi:hypothetical protein